MKWTDEALRKVRDAAMNYGIHCLDCHEHLTLAERCQGRAYCISCWPEELDEPPEDE